MIVFKNIFKSYLPGEYALQGVNFHIKAGEFVSLIGESGAGKTTLAKLLIAEEQPSKGTITVGGWDISNIKSKEIPALRRQIGVVFQDFKLLPQKTVFENVAFALEVCGYSGAEINEIVPHVLKLVGLENKLDRYPRQLSGGEQQRVVVARALVHRPKILVADEPTGNLDALNSQDVLELLLKINEMGTTVILVTHNRQMVNMLKRRVIHLEEGMVTADKEVGRYVG